MGLSSPRQEIGGPSQKCYHTFLVDERSWRLDECGDVRTEAVRGGVMVPPPDLVKVEYNAEVT